MFYFLQKLNCITLSTSFFIFFAHSNRVLLKRVANVILFPGVPLAELREHLYVHYEDRAVSHVFSVASGLESMAVGEGQILGQLRMALRSAQKRGQAGGV